MDLAGLPENDPKPAGATRNPHSLGSSEIVKQFFQFVCWFTDGFSEAEMLSSSHPPKKVDTV